MMNHLQNLVKGILDVFFFNIATYLTLSISLFAPTVACFQAISQ
jgi:hypothetical protein